jgi:hypothetical protein
MGVVRYSAQEELRKTRNGALIATLLILCAVGVFVYLGNRSQRVNREAAAESVEAAKKAYEPFLSRVKLLDAFASSLVEEDRSAKTIERMAIGSTGPPPEHPRILRKPYPMIGQVEQAIGKADSLEAQEPSHHAYPSECVLPIHLWHMRDPLCHEKTGPAGAESGCDRTLLVAGFAKDGRLCYLETYQSAAEVVGRNWGVWSYEIHGYGDQHPTYRPQ